MIEIKTLISHEMESGQRKDAKGETIPRKIINKFTASFNGKPVFSADLLWAQAGSSFRAAISDALIAAALVAACNTMLELQVASHVPSPDAARSH